MEKTKIVLIVSLILIIIFIVGYFLLFTNEEESLQEEKGFFLDYKELEFEEVDRGLTSDFTLIGDCENIDLWVEEELREEDIAINSLEKYEEVLHRVYEKMYERFLQSEGRYDSVDYTYEEFFEICNIFPEIDFSEKTLLGNHSSASGYGAYFEKSVYKDPSKKEVVYDARAIGEGVGEQHFSSMNWIIVPKINPDYNIIFK